MSSILFKGNEATASGFGKVRELSVTKLFLKIYNGIVYMTHSLLCMFHEIML